MGDQAIHRVYHAGELEAQRRFGVTDLAEVVGETVSSRLGVGVRRFVETQPFFFVATADAVRGVRCALAGGIDDSLGGAALIEVPDSKTLLFPLDAAPGCGLDEAVGDAGTGIGLLFVDFFGTGMRYRINGHARVLEAGAPGGERWPASRLVRITVDQAYTNCSARVVRLRPAAPEPALDDLLADSEDVLTAEATAIIEAPRFFILATANERGDCDCSYRGRAPARRGFAPLLRVLGPSRLVFPDYAGNNMFNSIGNLLVNPALSMLFVDFGRQAVCRVDGRARIEQDRGAWSTVWPDALRYVVVAVERFHRKTMPGLPGLITD